MRIAYYVSSHGFGHGTRSVALIASLLSHSHEVLIATSAPALVFDEVCLPLDAPNCAVHHRRAVDPVVRQPLAYSVARNATFDALREFVAGMDERVAGERAWLAEQRVELVLGDAPWIGFEAAKALGIPSVLVSNFTFDAVYSYLSTPLLDPSSLSSPTPPPHDTPVSPALLSPLVSRVCASYACADLLVRLPGALPIPSFDGTPWPAEGWVDPERSEEGFTPETLRLLEREPESIDAGRGRRIIDAPLVVRKPSRGIKTPERRREVLLEFGVPEELHAHRLLLVSFGGQVIARPSSPTTSAPPSASPSSTLEADAFLPPGWIAIVCGLAGSNSSFSLPDNFFAARGHAYVPDLTVLADVVLGKLGYGTCSETLYTRTPMLYVPRPLFIEEHGLLRLMRARGIAVSLSRADFERGAWACGLLEAWEAGKGARWTEGEEKEVAGGAAEWVAREIERWVRERGDGK